MAAGRENGERQNAAYCADGYQEDKYVLSLHVIFLTK
jgi:hypothetical protein